MYSSFPFPFPSFLILSTSIRRCLFVLVALFVCNSHSCVLNLCKSKQRTVKVWMNGFGLFGFSGTFPCCCTVELSWIYCIFSLRERFRVTLLQYCDDYLKIVNCTEFTIVVFVLSVGIPYKRCILCFCSFFFSSQTVENQIVQLQEFIPSSAFFQSYD